MTPIDLANLGLSVIPLGENSKRPIFPWIKYQSQRAPETKIREWIEKFPGCNWGVVTGKISEVVVFDLDDYHDPRALDVFMERAEYEGETSWITRTAGGGYHVWFKHPGTALNNRAWRYLDLDFRGDGGYVVVPPSHDTRGAWSWFMGNDQPYAPCARKLPDHLIEMVLS